MQSISYKNKVAIVYLLGFFVDLISMFIANVAFPKIGQALNADVNQLSWIANAYTLGLAIVIPLSSWLSQRFGAKRLFVTSLVIFSLAVLGGGLANSIGVLIAWRFIQGMGGGLLIPIGQSLAYQAFPGKERIKLTTMVMATATLAPALSPTLGGIMSQYLNWRWDFFINIPMALVALGLAAAWLKRDEAASHRVKLDWTGFGLVGAAVVLMLYALACYQSLADLSGTLGLLVLAIALLVGFYLHAKKAAQPLFDVSELKNPLLSTGMLLYIMIPGGFMGISLVNIYFFQNILGMTPVRVGALMIPFAIAAFIAIQLTGKLFSRLGSKLLLLAGIAANVLAAALLLATHSGEAYTYLMAIYFLFGLGCSIVSSTAQTMAMLHIEHQAMPRVSAMWNLNRQVGFSIGVAFFTMAMQLFMGAQHLALPTYSVSTLDASQLQSWISLFHQVYWVAIVVSLLPILRVLAINYHYQGKLAK